MAPAPLPTSVILLPAWLPFDEWCTSTNEAWSMSAYRSMALYTWLIAALSFSSIPAGSMRYRLSRMTTWN